MGASEGEGDNGGDNGINGDAAASAMGACWSIIKDTLCKFFSKL